jgi:hypothetical protein
LNVPVTWNTRGGGSRGTGLGVLFCQTGVVATEASFNGRGLGPLMNRKSAQRIEQLTQKIKGNEAQTTSLPAGTTLRRRKLAHGDTPEILA